MMTPTNEQIIAEANRRRKERGMDGLLLADFIIEVMREGWTPPAPVDPDLLAFREWFAHLPGRLNQRVVLAGSWDISADARAYLAGARMATERERERAKVLVRGLENISDPAQDEISRMALNALAKYRGEA